MLTDTDAELENGLRILARMIARAYLKDTRSADSNSGCPAVKGQDGSNGVESTASTGSKEAVDERTPDK